MAHGIVLGFGIGLLAYGCVKLLFGGGGSKGKSKSAETEMKTVEAPLVQPQARIEAETVEAAAAPPEQAAPCESRPEPVAETVFEEGVTDVVAPVAEQSLSDAPVPKAASWFLIRTSNGVLRACRLDYRTPCVTAGPFSTKEEANKAKARQSSRKPRPATA